jgi:hypothetical protein
MPFVSSKRPEEIKKRHKLKFPQIHLWSNDYREMIEGPVEVALPQSSNLSRDY